ncbi:PIN domain-containing protein, partial [Gluconobacter albidus]
VTHHVFLDTQVYRSLGHNLDSPPLLALREQIAADRLVLHITDITLCEIKRQIGSNVGDAANSMNEARKKFSIWKGRLPANIAGDFPTFDQTAISEAAFEQFYKRVRAEWSVVDHNATSVAALDIFNDYFHREPPFESIGSKEFPDAFVVQALVNWCIQKETKMYVVGADKAMAAAVDRSPMLLHMQSLPKLLESIAATETPDINDRTRKLLAKPAVSDGIARKIENKLDELIPIYVGDLADGEVSGHELNGKMEIDDFTVLAASNQDISVILKVRIPLKINIDFEDRSSAFYDNEDDIYVGTEFAQTNIEDEPIIRVFAKLTRKPPSVVGIQIMTSEFEVYDNYDDY